MKTQKKQSKWKGRSLINYKKQQEKRAKSKGVYEQLLNCRTLTQARKLLRGE